MDARIWLAVAVVLFPGAGWGEEPSPLQPALRIPTLAPTPVGKPLPALPTNPQSPKPRAPKPGAPKAATGDLAEHWYDQPADTLAMPPWLLPDNTDRGLPLPLKQLTEGAVADAFEVDLLALRSTLVGGPSAGVADPQVQLASVSEANEEPWSATRLADAEKRASEARTVRELTVLIEDCRGGDDAAAKELAPVVAWALNRRGELRAATGDERTAFEDFQEALRVDADCWSALHNRAVTLARYGRQTEALEDFTTVLRLNPDFASGYANRAELLLELGQPVAAEADFTRALADEPEKAVWLAGRATAWTAIGRRDEAASDLNEALRLDPRAVLYAQRGALFAEARHYEQAVADFDAALRADPHCVAAYQGLAWLLSTCEDERFRDPAKALSSAQRALKFGNAGDPLLLTTMAAAQAASDDFARAVSFQQQALLIAEPTAKERHQQRLQRFREGRSLYESPTNAGN